MANSKGFDLAAVLGSVSDLNTAEQIVKLPVELLDPDPDNFYSLGGLDELAGNIELMGLLDPIRVRPSGERYTVVSGHRRRAAILLIRDGGSEQFKDGVPCIVEYGEASDAMRRLRLIYANANTRQLTSAELSRQADEVARLLYELKEQGIDFPGRMRDHVAQACGVTKSKIARLHAIRANLIPELLERWDAGDMVEDAAYQLSRFPGEIQRAVAERMAQPNVTRWPSSESMQIVLRDLEAYQKPRNCPAKAGETCGHRSAQILRNVCEYSWNMCRPDACCLSCANSGKSCSGMCKAGRERVKLNKAVEAERKKEREKAEAASEAAAQKKLRKTAARILTLAERAGLPDSASCGSYGKAKVAELREVVAGKAKANRWQLEPYGLDEAREWARKLKCTVSEVIGEELPKPAPEWRDGTPEREGWYAVRLLFLGKPLFAPRVFWWNGSAWVQKDEAEKERALDRACEVVCWTALPAEEAVESSD